MLKRASWRGRPLRAVDLEMEVGADYEPFDSTLHGSADRLLPSSRAKVEGSQGRNFKDNFHENLSRPRRKATAWKAASLVMMLMLIQHCRGEFQRFITLSAEHARDLFASRLTANLT